MLCTEITQFAAQLWPFGNAENLLLLGADDARISPRSLLSLGLGIVARTFTGELSVVGKLGAGAELSLFWIPIGVLRRSPPLMAAPAT
jgi:hypothetical protein